MAVENVNKKRKKNKKIISFDTETITREEGTKLIENQNKLDELKQSQANSKKIPKKPKLKRKNNEELRLSDESSGEINKSSDIAKSSKKLKVTQQSEETTESNETDKSGAPKKESIRARKKKKYEQLLADQKIKAELAMQQKSLNYISKWKHSRSDWKFEKLRQIWLQQNLFDSSKIPEEFWANVLEYFCGSKGHIRKVILEEAVKIIDTEDEENEEEEYRVKVKRAREVVQNLQE